MKKDEIKCTEINGNYIFELEEEKKDFILINQGIDELMVNINFKIL
jgi:hypothetical protein